MTIEPAANTNTRQFFGTVVAKQTVDLALQVSGQIQEFPVLEGDILAEGDLIAQLDLEPYERALEQSILSKDQADRALSRLQRLAETTASEAAIEDGQTDADLADVAVRDAEYNLENATLLAPFDGLVAERTVANFTTVDAGTPVVRLHDISEWRVDIEVPEILFRTAGDEPDLTIYGTFSGQEERRIPMIPREFNAEASSIGQSFTITLAMLEEPGPGVLPGTSITVTVSLNTDDQVIVVPPSAISIGDDGATHLMVFEAGNGDDGTVRREPVDLTTGPNGEFILASGLEEGAEIVVSGAARLEDGQAVRRFNGFTN